MRLGSAQQASWGLWWGCAWASARGLRWGMRRGDGVCVGHGAWGVAVALVESVGGLVGLGCRFSLPVVAPYAPGGGLLWVPRWSAGSPNHDGLSAASGCRTRDARWTRAHHPSCEHLRAAHPEIRRDACFLAACIVFLRASGVARWAGAGRRPRWPCSSQPRRGVTCGCWGAMGAIGKPYGGSWAALIASSGCMSVEMAVG